MTTSNLTSVAGVGFEVVKRLTKNGFEPPTEISNILSTMRVTASSVNMFKNKVDTDISGVWVISR